MARWFVWISLLWFVGFLSVGCGPGDPCASVICDTGLTCQNGLCQVACSSGQTLCGQTCSDTQTDAKHCGGCNKACKTGESCLKGQCTPQCEEGKTGCNGECVDPQTNNNHCGACGTACSAGTECQAGECKTSCSGSTTFCGDACVDTSTNAQHCGACEKACKTGEECSGGQCGPSCSAGETACSGACVDLQTSATHCGACGTACQSGEECKAGTCSKQCPQGQTLCSDNQCYDLQSNPDHCGACEKACSQGESCSKGVCEANCPNNETDCSGNCVDLQTSTAHCGSCGTACTAGQTCETGQCTVVCKSTETKCSDTCVDTTSDSQHCGACNKACASGSGCCDSACIDLQADTKNCGACNNVCATGKLCQGGSCVCPQGETDCSGTCFDTQSNNMHCGACNNACKTNEICEKGTCALSWSTQGTSYSFDSSDLGYRIKFDSQGNYYVIGGFSTRLELGSLSGSTPNSGVFIAKFNKQGDAQWLEVLPINNNVQRWAFDVDIQGSVYIAGTFSETKVTFGSFTITNPPTTVQGFYTSQVFVAKMDTSGKWLFATAGGSGSNAEVAIGVAGDTAGSTYVIGHFGDQGNSVFGTTTLTSKGQNDVFVAKLDAKGAWQWVIVGGGKGNDSGSAIDIDGSGNVFVVGNYQQTAAFGFTSLNSQGSDDIFVGKLTPAGTWVWVNRGGGKSYEQADAMVVDNGLIYITGRYQSEGLFGTLSVTSQGSMDIFVAQLNGNGLFQWVATAGGAGLEEPYDIAVDGSSNVYVTGNFSTKAAATSYATFGSTTLKSGGPEFFSDIFVAKLNSTGSWQWAQSYGGTSDDRGRGIATSGSSVYITGGFSTESTFGTTTLTSKGNRDIFVAQVDTSGTLQRVTGYAGQQSAATKAFDVARDSSGNLYVVGQFQDRFVVGSTTLNSQSGVNDTDVYVLKYSAQGSLLWAKSGGAKSSEDKAMGVDVDSSGNVYVVGSMAGNQSGSFGTLTVSNKGNSLFVAKLDTNGNWQWVRADAPAPSQEVRSKIKVDSGGNIYVSGSSGTGSFGSLTFKTQGPFAMYVAKLNATGSWQWLATNTGKLPSAAHHLALDKAGNVVVAGSSQTETYDSLPFKSNGESDVFVGKVNPQGKWLWVQSLGSTFRDEAKSIAIDAQDNVYVTGHFQDKITVGTTTYTSQGIQDIFLGKLNGSGAWQWLSTAGGMSEDHALTLELDGQGNTYVGGFVNDKASFGSLTIQSIGLRRALYVARADSKGQWDWVKSAQTEDMMDSELTGIKIGGTGRLYVAGHFTGDLTFLSQPVQAGVNTDMFLGIILP